MKRPRHPHAVQRCTPQHVFLPSEDIACNVSRLLAESDGQPPCSAPAVLPTYCKEFAGLAGPCLGDLSHCRQQLTPPHCLATPPLTGLDRKPAPQAAPSWALGVKRLGRPKTDYAMSRGHPLWTTQIRLPGRSAHVNWLELLEEQQRESLLGLARVQSSDTTRSLRSTSFLYFILTSCLHGWSMAMLRSSLPSRTRTHTVL